RASEPQLGAGEFALRTSPASARERRAADRDLQDEPRAARRRGVSPDPPAVCVRDRLHDRKPKPRAPGLAGAAVVEAPEPVEDGGPLVGRDAGTVVVDDEP